MDQAAIELLGIPSLLLMENAAGGVCNVILRGERPASVVIICGPGNNGGDGLAIARLLASHGVTSGILRISGGRQLSPDSAANLHFLERCGIPAPELTCDQVAEILQTLRHTDLIVDALLGTGVKGSIRSPFDQVIRSMNESRARILAVDVPSGLDCDTGVPAGIAVKASETVTFVAMKTGFLNSEALAYTGHITVAQIGIPLEWLERFLAAEIYSSSERTVSRSPLP